MKPVIAIIGRPNVGKSTLFNRLAGESKAIVIDEPGATRDRNYADCTWNDRPFTLIDTGGFEPASEVEILVQMREQTKLAIEEADIILFLMDGRDGLTPADQEIARMLRMVNKTGLLHRQQDRRSPPRGRWSAEFYRLGIETLYPLSAQHGPGLDELMDDVASASRRPNRSRTAKRSGSGSPSSGGRTWASLPWSTGSSATSGRSPTPFPGRPGTPSTPRSPATGSSTS